MGTTGTGNLGDYRGGKPEGDRCERAFSADLEEVGRCAYFAGHGDLPPVGAAVRVVASKRMTVISGDAEEEIGFLPTEYNYLRQCIREGHSYSGVVQSSSLRPIPRVIVDIAPTS